MSMGDAMTLVRMRSLAVPAGAAETDRNRKIVDDKMTVVAGVRGNAVGYGVYRGGYVDGPVAKAEFDHPQGSGPAQWASGPGNTLMVTGLFTQTELEIDLTSVTYRDVASSAWCAGAVWWRRIRVSSPVMPMVLLALTNTIIRQHLMTMPYRYV